MRKPKKKIKSITNELEVREFISSHAGEIKGLYQDSFTKMGGWNGLMYALGEVENRYGVEINCDEIIPSEDFELNVKSNTDLFERIINEEL